MQDSTTAKSPALDDKGMPWVTPDDLLAAIESHNPKLLVTWVEGHIAAGGGTMGLETILIDLVIHHRPPHKLPALIIAITNHTGDTPRGRCMAMVMGTMLAW